MSAEFISRLQFAFTVLFHMTFPAFTIGLSIYLSVMYGMYWRTHKLVYYQVFKFFRKIFAVGFALGVVAGIVITFQFGLNWGIYGAKTGPILGPIIGMEVVSAFFVEATFLGVLLYGDGKVSERLMFISSVLVAIGTVSSSTWILIANSWMQTPAGFKMDAAGRFVPANWWHIIFNPSFGIRWCHIIVGVLITASVLVMGIAAYFVVKHSDDPELFRFGKRSVSIGLGIMAILIPIQMSIGDTVALNYVAKDQLSSNGLPSKLAAMEGHWEAGSSYIIVAWPSNKEEKNLFEIAVPHLGSVIAMKDFSGKSKILGMKQIPKAERPWVWAVFGGFRMMYYGAIALLATAFIGLVLRLRGKLFTSKKYMKWLLFISPAGFLAVWGGWITAEAGRQPWVVWGQLATKDAASHISTAEVMYTLSVFLIIYLTLITAYIMYIVRTTKKGPDSIADIAKLLGHQDGEFIKKAVPQLTDAAENDSKGGPA